MLGKNILFKKEHREINNVKYDEMISKDNKQQKEKQRIIVTNDKHENIIHRTQKRSNERYRITVLNTCDRCIDYNSIVVNIIPNAHKCEIIIDNFQEKKLYSGLLKKKECDTINKIIYKYDLDENIYYSFNLSDRVDIYDINIYVRSHHYRIYFNNIGNEYNILDYGRSQEKELYIIMGIINKYTLVFTKNRPF